MFTHISLTFTKHCIYHEWNRDPSLNFNMEYRLTCDHAVKTVPRIFSIIWNMLISVISLIIKQTKNCNSLCYFCSLSNNTSFCWLSFHPFWPLWFQGKVYIILDIFNLKFAVDGQIWKDQHKELIILITFVMKYQCGKEIHVCTDKILGVWNGPALRTKLDIRLYAQNSLQFGMGQRI